jgi:NADPH-dependent 2,4-dienoyl-CoA reductase/sulfur reductase-like enzyme
MQHRAEYVLVGGGLASATAAQTIRKFDTSNSILLIGAESRLPYNRPPLSKEYLSGEAGEDVVPIKPEQWYKDNDVTLMLGEKAVSLDTAGKILTLENGDIVNYSKLLLATGSTPKTLDVPGGDSPHVFYLRTWDDSNRLQPHLTANVIIVGGGYIAVEVAADVLQSGGRATIIHPDTHLWKHSVSSQFGDYLKRKLEDAGATIISEDKVIRVTETGVETQSGRHIDGSVILAAVGVRTNLELAESAGLLIDENLNGVRVDEYLESSVPGVWAAGDIASFCDPTFKKQWRIEHYNNAQWHGEIAGSNMAGERTKYDHVSNFFSDELNLHFELYGVPGAGKGGLFHGDPSSDRFDELYVDEGGHIMMTASINPPDDLFDTLDQLTRQCPSVFGREEEIRKADFDLKKLLK